MSQMEDNWQKHPDLYMSDGTMVLLAGSTLFRVYPGLLAKHSNVFEGLTQSSSHLPADAETYDGCPVVRLPDDPEDVAHFLKATMGLCHFEINQPMSYPAASAILRLSSKYMVQSLRRQAIEHFRRIIPQSYGEIGKTHSFSTVFGSQSSDIPHPFQLLSLFQECRLMTCLPWSYYCVCALGFEKLVQGDTHNGSEIFLEQHTARIALLGWKSLCTMTRDIRNDTIVSSAPECKGLPPCTDNMRLGWLQIAAYRIGSDTMKQWDMFKLLQIISVDDGLPSAAAAAVARTIPNARPCSSCCKTWLKQEENARSVIWSKLPSIFQLPAWETLKREEEC